MKKRVLSLFLALTLCLTLLPTAAFAEGETGGSMSGNTTIGDSESGGEGGGVLVGENEKTGGGFVVSSEQNKTGSSSVAKAGDTEYETLQEILEEMEPVEITLLGDVTEDITVYAATIINMDGHSITGNVDVTLTESGENLTLTNGTVVGKVTVDASKGTFTMTAPVDAAAAIDGGLEVKDGSCSVSGAKIGVKDMLSFGGDELTISGTEKAVELNSAATLGGSKKLYGAATVGGDTSTEAVFEDGTYKVGTETAKKLSTTQVGGEPEPEKPTLTINPKRANANAGESATFTVTYDGEDTLNAYVQVDAIADYFTFRQTNNGNGTYTITVAISEDTPTGDYKLYVHETNDTSVQAEAIVKVTPAACSHGGVNGFDINATSCPDCGAPAVAYTGLKNVTGNPWRKFADLQTALDADRDGGSVVCLLADVTGDYTIDGSQDTGLDLNGYSIKGTVTVTGKGGEETAFSNSKSTGTIQAVAAHENAKLAVSGAAAVIEKLTLAEGATWENIVFLPRNPGYKLYTNYPDLTTYKWYAPVDVPDGTTELTYVKIESLPITSKNLSFRVDGKTVTSAERGTTVQLCASCNTSGADVYIYVGELVGDGTFTYSQKQAEYKKIGKSWFYVVDFAANTIGTYSVYFTASKDGYSVSSDPKTLTVTKATIPTDAITAPTANTLTYNGHAQKLVTAGSVDAQYGTMQYSLARSASSFSTEIPTKTDAGTYTVYYKVVGAEGYKDSTVNSIKVTISPVKIDHVMFSKDIAKTYSGSAEFSLTTAERSDCLRFYGEASSLIDVDPGAYAIVGGVRFLAKNAEDELVDSPEAGKKSYMQFTVKLHSSNYVLQTPDGTAVSELTCIQSGGAAFTITQATVTPAEEITQLVFNDLAKTYTLDLAALLPELPIGCEYGSILNRGCDFHFTDSTYLDSSNNIFVSNEGILTLPIVSAHSTDVNGQIGTITVPIVSTNYRQFDLTIKVVIGEKITLDQSGVTVSATDITYGQTLAESTLTATGSMICPRMHTEIPGTFAWTNGTIKPNAGSYDAEWTFTPAEGYEEYAPATGKVTIHVNKAQLTGVSVSQNGTLFYSGQPQRANVTATAATVDGTSVEFWYGSNSGGSFDTAVPAFTEAGTYTVYYYTNDPAENHEISSGEFTVTIAPLPISFLSVEKISKSYDGTANVTLSASMLTFFSKTASVSDIKLPDTALTFSSAQFTKKQADRSYQPSPEAGGGKALSFTMTLANDNYVFEREPEGTKTISDTFATDDTTRFTITKAAAPTDIQTGTLNVINGTKLEYTYDAKQLLPDATKGTYGKVSYNCVFPFKLVDGYSVDDITIAGSVLTLTIDALNGGETGKVGTIPIDVTTDNYEPFNLPLDLYAVNKITPVAAGDITASEITYGDALSKSEISGKMKDPNTGAEVKGTFTWNAPDTMLNAGDREDDWTFTPDAPEYAAVTGKATIKVNPKSIVGAIVTLGDTFVYDGTEKEPKIISVVLDGVTLTGPGRDKDYGFSYNRTTEVGTYHDDLSIGGQNNYTGELKFTWSITPREVTPTIEVASCSYTGEPLTPTVTLTDDLGNTIDPKEYTVAYSNNTNAGAGRVTIKDIAGGNYVIEEISQDFPISQAVAPTTTSGTLTITNGLHKTYSFDLSTLLPKLDSLCDYGTITYGKPVADLGVGSFVTHVNSKTGELTLEADRNSKDEGQFGTITVTVSTVNYQDITLIINVIAKNKLTPVLDGKLTLTPAEITYGDALSKIMITGTMKVGDTVVEGEFTWQYPNLVHNKAGTYMGDWKFTPKDGSTYTEATGKVQVTVNNAKQSATLVMESYTYGETPFTPYLKDRTGNMEMGVTYQYFVEGGGTTQVWDIDNPPALSAGTYTMRATIAGAQNYDEFTTADVQFTVAKATPDFTSGTTYTKPTGLTAIYGQTLADVTLTNPAGNLDGTWSWMDSTVSVGNVSTTAKTFKAKFTPKDIENYNTVENIELEVMVNKADQAMLTIEGEDSVAYGETLTLKTTGGTTDGKVTYSVGKSQSSGGDATIDENGVLTPTKVGTISVTATMAGDENYNDVTSYYFVISIRKGKPTGEPKYTQITTGGKTLKDAVLTLDGGTLNPNVGQLEWVNDEGGVLPDDTLVEANKAYKWRFTPTDINYTPLTGEVELYHKSSGGSGSSSGSYTITVKDAQNGDVTTDRKSASAGTTVTITVKPDSGYVLDDLTVTDSKGNDLKLTGKGGGKYTFTMPSGKVTVEASFAPAKSENPFTDVPSGAYYEDAVIWAVNNGITGGTSATTFDPNGFCTRAQAVTFLWRAAGSPAPKSTAMPFADVPAGSYYYDAVLWAIENGITKGTSDTTFSPNANCSRGQIVTFLWRSQKSPDAAVANPFTDVAANAYYTSAVLWAVEKSITGGTSATTFSPSANCTRAQIVTFIYRCMK